MQVIGVGFGRTATMSLRGALTELGAGPCFHMIDLINGPERERDLALWTRIADGEQVPWAEVFDGWEATVDWPGCTFWTELVDAFPDAKVLLNVRDFDGWYASSANTLLAIKQAAIAGELEPDANRPQPSPLLWGVIERVIWQGDFQGRFEDRDAMRTLYEERIATIRATVAPERLTVWKISDGWAPLAAMLGVDVPETPSPGCTT